MPSPQTINTIVWTFSLALQMLLVVAVFGRGLARRLPCFTILIVFYPLRSALLFALIGHIPPADYAALYSTLSLIDILLQIAFVLEIGFRLIRRLGKLTLRNCLFVFLPLSTAAVGASIILTLLPHHAPIPADRIQTFVSCLLIGLFLSTVLTTTSPLLRITTLGFALYSSVSLIAQAARLNAALHRNAAAYSAWSYATAAAYLLIVLLWFFALKPEGSTKTLTTPDPNSSLPRQVTP
jgi:hypothetical protein